MQATSWLIEQIIKYELVPKETHPDNVLFHQAIEMEKQITFDFAEWMVENVSFIDNIERGNIYKYKDNTYTTEELFEKFLKTKK